MITLMSQSIYHVRRTCKSSSEGRRGTREWLLNGCRPPGQRSGGAETFQNLVEVMAAQHCECVGCH